MNLRRNALSLGRDVIRLAPFARPDSAYPAIADLGIIGDRHTAAVVDRDASIVFYCPGRFDSPSLFASMLDPALGGSWKIRLEGAAPAGRRYLDTSAVLETKLAHPDGVLTVTDWMNLGQTDIPHGMICRRFTEAPVDYRIVVTPRPDYGREIPHLRRGTQRHAVIDRRFHLHSSHDVTITGGGIEIAVPKGQRAWAVLSDAATATPMVTDQVLDHWLEATLKRWEALADRCKYNGPWAEHVANSVRALHMLVYEQTGAIVAAATMGLPEVVGGGRNYDYRYAWLRDSGMIVRGLLRFETDTETACRHLGVFAALRGSGHRPFLDPVWTVGGERVPLGEDLPLAGYKRSRPVTVGNPAGKQLQIGSLANLLLGMKETYARGKAHYEWDAVCETVDFLIENWSEQGHGIWEEQKAQQFTASRVFTVCAMEGLAAYVKDPARKERWMQAARTIRAEIEKHFHTPSGTYAAARGLQGVDMSVALFPVWGYCAPDDPLVAATVAEIERDYSPRRGLFHRDLQKRSAERKEGSFLAGTFWLAHYWVVRGNLDRARELIEAGLGCANDLGLFSEEIDDSSGQPLGNIPLGLVHGSMLAAIADYAEALDGKKPQAAEGELVGGS